VQAIVVDCNSELATACRRYAEAKREHGYRAEVERIGRLRASERERKAWRAHRGQPEG
jgi:hypothetical protein